MSNDLSLTLRFRPLHREVSCYEFAALFEDVEALYLAVPEALAAEQPVARHFALQHQIRTRQLLGSSDSLLAEIEYRARALRQLETAGAPEDALRNLRHALSRLTEADVERVAEGSRPESRQAHSGLSLQRVSMQSPAELVASIPAAYWAASGTSLLLFLGAIERRFNMVGRIKAERAELAARRRKAEVEETRALRVLKELRERDESEEMANRPQLLDGLAATPQDRLFELEEGELGLAEAARDATTELDPDLRPRP
ncbi:MAG TPA: hypothetical protein VF093_09705 [Solirubrobacterales bacterium]